MDVYFDKNFSRWIKVKENLHNVGRVPVIKEGEIWWAAVGENVGVEINGKNDVFSRPVLIYKKLSRQGFLAIPLTTKKHEGEWYAPFLFQNRAQVAALAQVRMMSVSRLYKRMGTISDKDFDLVVEKFQKLFFRK